MNSEVKTFSVFALFNRSKSLPNPNDFVYGPLSRLSLHETFPEVRSISNDRRDLLTRFFFPPRKTISEYVRTNPRPIISQPPAFHWSWAFVLSANQGAACMYPCNSQPREQWLSYLTNLRYQVKIPRNPASSKMHESSMPPHIQQL